MPDFLKCVNNWRVSETLSGLKKEIRDICYWQASESLIGLNNENWRYMLHVYI